MMKVFFPICDYKFRIELVKNLNKLQMSSFLLTYFYLLFYVPHRFYPFLFLIPCLTFQSRSNPPKIADDRHQIPLLISSEFYFPRNLQKTFSDNFKVNRNDSLLTNVSLSHSLKA